MPATYYPRAIPAVKQQRRTRVAPPAAQPLPPVLAERGPCQEQVLLGDEADLTRFPAPIWNALDGGPYLTCSCHIARDLTLVRAFQNTLVVGAGTAVVGTLLYALIAYVIVKTRFAARGLLDCSRPP